jgi:hypothetical protein
MSKVRTIKQIEKEISALIQEGKDLANEQGELFEVLDQTFYPGSEIVKMCNEDDDNYVYLDDWYADQYGKSGKWMSSSDFC